MYVNESRRTNRAVLQVCEIRCKTDLQNRERADMAGQYRRRCQPLTCRVAPMSPCQEMLAEDPQSVGVGFSSGGFLLPYHMGVLAALRREGIVHGALPPQRMYLSVATLKVGMVGSHPGVMSPLRRCNMGGAGRAYPWRDFSFGISNTPNTRWTRSRGGAETTRVAGTSTGTFAVSAIVGGLDDEQFKLALQLLLQRCRPYLNEGLTGVLRVREWSRFAAAGGTLHPGASHVDLVPRRCAVGGLAAAQETCAWVVRERRRSCDAHCTRCYRTTFISERKIEAG